MKFTTEIILSVIYVFGISSQVNGAKILGIFTVPSYSHQIPFRRLWLELHKRGHEVTLITHVPIPNINSTTFRQIDIGQMFKLMQHVNFVEQLLKGERWLDYLNRQLEFLSSSIMEFVFQHPEVKRLYAPDSKETFDAVLIEMFYEPALHSFGHRFNAPVIGLSPMGLTAFENYAIGGPVLASHESTWEMEENTGSKLSYWKRLTNFCRFWYMLYYANSILMPLHQKLAEKYMGKPMPPVQDMMKDVSLVFVNEEPVMSYALPQLPVIIKFHSAHFTENVQPLPKDLKKFIESAKGGFIYFSMGSAIRFSDISDQIKQILLDVFSKLPYKVVLKYEVPLAQLHENIYAAPWLPQRSILAQPNIKLCIHHGGLHSTEEAIHFGVPLLGFPVTADQEYQMKRVVSYRIGKRMTFKGLTSEDLLSNIKEIVTNKEYKENIIKISRLVNDIPYDPIENLAWWTEYVIRHKGAPHLRSNLAWTPWYEYYDVDVFALLLVVTLIAVSIAFWISVKFFEFIYGILSAVSVGYAKKRR